VDQEVYAGRTWCRNPGKAGTGAQAAEAGVQCREGVVDPYGRWQVVAVAGSGRWQTVCRQQAGSRGSRCRRRRRQVAVAVINP